MLVSVWIPPAADERDRIDTIEHHELHTRVGCKDVLEPLVVKRTELTV